MQQLGPSEWFAPVIDYPHDLTALQFTDGNVSLRPLF